MTYLFAHRYTISHKLHWNNALNYPRPTTHLLFYILYTSVQSFPPPQLVYLYRNTKRITCSVQLTVYHCGFYIFMILERLKLHAFFIIQHSRDHDTENLVLSSLSNTMEATNSFRGDSRPRFQSGASIYGHISYKEDHTHKSFDQY